MKSVTICGVSDSELVNGKCNKCGNGTICEIREQDWVEERIFNFCKKHNCLKPFARYPVYDEYLFLSYLAQHPTVIKSRKWLQEIAIQNNILF